MRITDLLNRDNIDLDGKVSNKSECIERMVELMATAGNITDKETYKKAVYDREELSTTGIGEGIAIPHAKSDAVSKPGLAAMVIPNGVDYDSIDGQDVTLIFLIAAPNSKDNVHLDVLSNLSMLLMDEQFTTNLRNAKTKDEFLHYIDEAENVKEEKEEEKERKIKEEDKQGYQVLAVTACPTGIAHTFMAAESLEKTAATKGIRIKVETNGSSGIKNKLTADDIARADCIIVAADKNVEMARFEGKPVIKTKVADGIHKADELLERAVKADAPIYHHSGGLAGLDDSETQTSEGWARVLYKNLMNGVSHMLPFTIGGGILIAIAFLLDDYDINPANFGSNTPIAALFKRIGDTAFGFMMPVLAGFIAMSIADRPGLAVGFVGGSLANAGVVISNLVNFDETTAVSSGFLGALLAGFLGGYIVRFLKRVLSWLPSSLEGIKPILLYPVLGIFLTGGIVIILNPFVGAINTVLTTGLNSMGGTSKVLLGIVVAGMMSIDMGGPFNKAAYVFGTAQLATGGFDIMAAVMAGGMVAPLVIAVCATFFRKRFTAKERNSAYVNYIMGASFISEGAIPFAASDPIRVIPSCIVGSAIAGGLSMLFGCAVRAPHGGLFVLPVITHPWLYLLAIILGAVIGGLLLAVLKKPVQDS